MDSVVPKRTFYTFRLPLFRFVNVPFACKHKRPSQVSWKIFGTRGINNWNRALNLSPVC